MNGGELALDTEQLASLRIVHAGRALDLFFRSGTLVVHSDGAWLDWFIDLTDLENEDFLQAMRDGSDLHVNIQAVTESGLPVEGCGWFHPNFKGPHASIRGEGELQGFMPDKGG